MNIHVINEKNEAQREIDIPEEVFGVAYRKDIIYEAVRNYTANQRLGTHSTKRRDEVSGSGRKIWKQKHTGRARMGEIRSPLWYHGGITFGPKPRDYSYAIPKKMRRGAMRSLLSERIRREGLAVIEGFAVDEPKTKAVVAKYGPLLDAHKTILFVDREVENNARLASRNIQGVKATRIGNLNVYDLARYDMVVFTEPALLDLAEVLQP